jgi:hypothetical protein
LEKFAKIIAHSSKRCLTNFVTIPKPHDLQPDAQSPDYVPPLRGGGEIKSLRVVGKEWLRGKFHNAFGEIRENHCSFLQTLWG